jgi:hypothetical protein
VAPSSSWLPADAVSDSQRWLSPAVTAPVMRQRDTEGAVDEGDQHGDGQNELHVIQSTSPRAPLASFARVVRDRCGQADNHPLGNVGPEPALTIVIPVTFACTSRQE